MKRSLKVEARMEDDRKYVIPYLRMRGKWLERMGFPPDRHVEVSMIEPGLLQIRLKPEGSEQEAGENGQQVGNGERSVESKVHSFEHCVARIEYLEEECHNAFSRAWREHCKREIGEWRAYVAKHHPGHRPR